jgi:hypothetical protein
MPWRDIFSFDCATYVDYDLCTPDGKIGPEWDAIMMGNDPQDVYLDRTLGFLQVGVCPLRP